MHCIDSFLSFIYDKTSHDVFYAWQLNYAVVTTHSAWWFDKTYQFAFVSYNNKWRITPTLLGLSPTKVALPLLLIIADHVQFIIITLRQIQTKSTKWFSLHPWHGYLMLALEIFMWICMHKKRTDSRRRQIPWLCCKRIYTCTFRFNVNLSGLSCYGISLLWKSFIYIVRRTSHKLYKFY